MRYQDIKVGDELYHEPSNRNWANRLRTGRRVVVLDTERHYRTGYYKYDYYSDKKGAYIKVRLPRDPNSPQSHRTVDRDEYVTIGSLRGPWAEVHAEDEKIREQQAQGQQQERDNYAASGKLVGRVHDKMAALGFTDWKRTTSHGERHRVGARIEFDAAQLETWLDTLTHEQVEENDEIIADRSFGVRGEGAR